MNGCKACLSIIENDNPIFYLSDIYMNSNSSCAAISIKEKLADCVPELRHIVNNAVICKRCVISLTAAYDFRQQCLVVQQKVCSYLQQMPVNTAISMEQIALYYKRQEDVAKETASKRNMVIKMETLPAMQEENLITEVVYESTNTCLTPMKPMRNIKMERTLMQEEVIRQGEIPLIIAADFMPNKLNMYSKIQSLQQQPTMYPENPAIATENNSTNSFSSDVLNRIQDSKINSHDRHNNITESLVMQETPKHAKKSVKKPKTSFACKTCSFKCKYEYLLNHHNRIHNKKNKVHCPSCNFRSKSVRGLHDHLKSKHYYPDAHGSGFSFHRDVLGGDTETSKKKSENAERLKKQIKLVRKMLPVWLQHQSR